MGLSGAWLGTQQTRDYASAGKWGDGYHPTHESRSAGRGERITSKLSTAPQGEPARVAVGEFIDSCEFIEGGVYADGSDDYPYLANRPSWGDEWARDSTNVPASGETAAWGAPFNDDPSGIWPLPGPTSGSQAWLDINHGELTERQTPIAIPGPGLTGGWLNKQRGALALSEAQKVPRDGHQQGMNTSDTQGQGVNEMANIRATARGTDDPRSPIRSRTAGMIIKDYARSFGMGGGPNTPDMSQQQMTVGLRRPWVYRTAATPPPEAHEYNEMEGRDPIARTMPADPWQGDPEDAGTADTYETWGY